jgi:hypothetical protein
VPANNKIIESIVLEGGTTIIAGRKADGSIISLKLSEGHLVLRTAIEGYIPIGTYEEFQLINAPLELSGSYRQEANLDLLNIEWAPIGNNPFIAYFSGIFDGSNHTLANLKISGNEYYVGLFGCNRGTIRNVHIISGSVSGGNYVGGVCGSNSCGTNYDYISALISKCSNACLVSGVNYVGGVCGSSHSYSGSASSYLSSHISACYNTGSVSGSGDYVGGVCGHSYSYSSFSSSCPYSYITSCYNTGSVSGNSRVGGVCGSSDSQSISSAEYSYSYITACYNTGSVLGKDNVGGICGENYSSSYGTSSSDIIACYNTGSVSGNSNVGGVCGYSYSRAFSTGPSSSSDITACYNTGSVSGSSSNVGGVCGENYSYSGRASSDITACYNIGSVSGNSNIGGVCGENSSVITTCYWQDISSDNADYGIGYYKNTGSSSSTGTTIFAPEAWPQTSYTYTTYWGIGEGSNGKYWKSLGGWYGENPMYPKLWFEE